MKATTIILSQPDDSDLESLIIRLGGLHVMMSFVGSIGTLMSGSGLKEVLQVAYADNAVTHMLSGKAIARAIRGHLSVYSALYALITSHALGISLPNNQILELSDQMGQDNQRSSCFDKEIKLVSDMLQDLLCDGSDELILEHSDCIHKIDQLLEETKKDLSTRRTARLRLQY